MIPPELESLRQDVIRIESALKQDQVACEPSHAGYRMSVPAKTGDYDAEDLKRIATILERLKAADPDKVATDPDGLLSRAVFLYNLESS